MPEPKSQGPDYLPVIVLVGLVGLFALGIWLFPYFQKIIQREDCGAVGRNDCL